ncbi:MFS transporter [Pseudoxanthomonas sp. JBR18]|uniref:MFS transporter n=1 Tax=Pseudoxanthomonas sp. JBR18 TaxID=2969308 RepID=UPI002306AC2E|nr:MFS transporter [Pseudoxanthomonas sp. JBR18]WCE06027.1 MFS transporter [Pseudoxanthomonas sp. JBR18]
MTQPVGTPTRPLRKAWIPFALALAPINLMLSVDRNAFMIVASQVQGEFGFSLEQMSYLLASIAWTYGIFQLPSGWLIQRFGFRRLMGIALVLWSLAIGLMPLASGFGGMLVLRLLLGAAQAPDWPSSVAAIAAWFPAEKRSRFTSLALSGQYIGPFIGAVATGLLTYHLGWRACFYLYAGIGLVLFALWWGLSRHVEHAGTPPAHRSTPIWPQVRALLSLRTTWLMSTFYFCLISIQAFFLSWMPVYLTKERGASLTESSWYSGMPWLTLYASVTLYGFWADFRIRRGHSLRAARLPAAVVGFCLGMSLALVPWIANVGVVVGILCLSLFGVGLVQGVVWSTVQDLGGERTALLASWTSFWGNMSAGLFPIIMAYLVEWTGEWKYAFMAPLACSIAGLVLAFFIPFNGRTEAAGASR